MARRFLFLATSSHAWGEVITARRIARALRERGDQVIMLAPSQLGPLLDAAHYDRLGFVDEAVDALIDVVPAVARSERCDCLMLIDVVSVFMHLEGLGQDGALMPAMRRANIPVIGLDVWNLSQTDRRWGFGLGREWIHSEHALEIVDRLCPVPFLSPDTSGAFSALPPPSPITEDQRASARAELGLGDDRLILLPTATWQLPEKQNFAHNRRLAELVPELLGRLIASVPAVRIAHVGPSPLEPLASALGGRYRHLPQMSPREFNRLMNACELVLTLNAAATTITSALAREVPVVLVVNSAEGRTFDEVCGDAELSPEIAGWVRRALPLSRFRVWPMGLYRFLTPVMANNPFTAAVEAFELLDGRRLTTALEGLLHHGGKQRALNKQRAYCELVRRLPSAVEVLDGHLD